MFIAVLFIIAKKWKTTQMSINWLIYKQNVVYTVYGIFLNIKKEWSGDTYYNVDKSWKNLC